jgi:DNA-binding response OmpR family regulator
MLTRTDPLRIRLEYLEEENRQLREKIAKLEGADLALRARVTFRLTPTEATIFCMLYRLRSVEHQHLLSVIFEDEHRDALVDEGEALRSHMKRMRRKTRPHGIDFRTVYCIGFEMGDEAHAIASRMMGEA